MLSGARLALVWLSARLGPGALLGGSWFALRVGGSLVLVLPGAWLPCLFPYG